jgi:hypothetical protein
MRMRTAWLAAAVAAAAGGTVMASATALEDDLAVVKRAVARQEVRTTSPGSSVRAEPPAPRTATELKWLKVRVTEKGAKKAKVTINLPINLVRALGDDFPLDFGSRRGHRDRERSIRLGEVLAALEAGSPLVEIDDEDSFVKVWVE